MPKGKLFSLGLALALVSALALSAGAAPATGPCAPGAGYDPACDVDHNGAIDVTDIQLTAGHWNQSGTWAGDNNHDHLGQTWTGSNNPLKITGNYSVWPDSIAPLTLNNTGGAGLHVQSTGDYGVLVQSAGTYGVLVNSAVLDGFYVHSAGGDGLAVCSTGAASGCTFDDSDNGVEIGNAHGSGVRVDSAGNAGVLVQSAGGAGVTVQSAEWGMTVGYAADRGVMVNLAVHDGVYVGQAGGDGLAICHAGAGSGCGSDPSNNGVEVGYAQHAGIRVNSAGSAGILVQQSLWNGMVVESAYGDGVRATGTAYNALYGDTTQANGEWGLYTPDKIRGSNVTLNSVTIVAQVGGEQSLAAGDLAAAVGVADALPGSTVPTVLVSAAHEANASGVVGVVEGRMVLLAKPQPADADSQPPVLELRSAVGPARPGDYVALTVLGVAQVKVDEGATIRPGQRLTASAIAGYARALRTELLNGMVVSEGAPGVGIVIAEQKPGQNTIAIYVTLR